MMKRIVIIFLVGGAVLSLNDSCASAGTYFKDRGLDFADMFSAKAGYGKGIGCGVSVFGIFNAEVGYCEAERWGFTGRYAVKDKQKVMGMPLINFSPFIISGMVLAGYSGHGVDFWACPASFIELPSTGLEEVTRDFKTRNAEVDVYFGLLGINICSIVGTSGGGSGKGADFLPDVKHLEGALFATHYYDLRVHLAFGFTSEGPDGVALEVGFSPVEFADFLLGWFCIDMAGDDLKTAGNSPAMESDGAGEATGKSKDAVGVKSP